MKRLALLFAVLPALALAQPKDVQVTRGPASDLYIKKRPPAPEAPVLSKELEGLLRSTEKRRDAKRTEAITLLRAFLASKPTGEAKAEGMFKLAELLWEESRRTYLVRMDDYSRAIEKCAQKKGECKQPVEPRIDLREAEKLYVELHKDHPAFRRMDLVTYLIGFAAKEDDREDEAMARFQEVIDKYPKSTLYGDAWMMVGEHYFAKADWVKARDAYKNISDDAATSDLATFKVAWCEWKLGNPIQAAKDFKRVLDKAVAAERTGTAAQRRRSASLRDEALEYLVVVFTEDRSVSAKEVFDFLASIGGEQYSRDVLLRVAESYAAQTEWERSNEAFRFLIKMDPESIKSAEYQRDIVANWNSALDVDRAQEEIKVLLVNFGPNSAWAKAQRNREALARSLDVTEDLVRTTATNMHGEAQRREKSDNKPDLNLYARAAAAYEQYLEAFATSQADPAKVQEIRFYRADILFFKLGRTEEAGDEYLAVGKSAPVGKWHKPALKQAMTAFEKARPKDTAGRRQMYPVDKKFGEAMDLYATLFKDDPELVDLIFKNGQLFYDYGDYDEAIKRFGIIVTQYPDHPNALGAGDRILKALVQGKDYENVETWARRLKKTKAFASKQEQERLDKLIVDAIGKSGDTYADAGKYEQAAGFYLRVPKEFPKSKGAPQMMMNAGVMYEKAKKPEAAAEVYLELADRYSSSDLADNSAFSAGQLYEKVAYFDRAAEAYELVGSKFPKSKDAADALYNAGVLRQALGQYDKAIGHFQAYAKRYRDRKDAPEVAFRIGAVYEESGDDGRADQAFRAFTKQYKDHRRVIEAHVRAGRSSFRLGQYRRAAEELETAQKLYKKASGSEKTAATPWAAEARYWQGELMFREYEKVSLAVKPKQLDKTLAKKTDLLVKAQGVYFSVVEYKDLRWATAALYRVGNIFEQYAASLRNAPTPNDLSPPEQEAYRGALDMAVVDIEEKAIQLYTTGYQKAIEMQVYDEYTSKIREALGRLAADEFPPEREGRADVRIGDRPLDVKVIREVNR
jgi:TolA-binding protein